jgi:hypothetical protein
MQEDVKFSVNLTFSYGRERSSLKRGEEGREEGPLDPLRRRSNLV